MTYTSPAVVIDNGSHTTKAGFALDDLPSLVFSSNYLIGSDGDKSSIVIGDDEIAQHPEGEIMTLLENGLIYNFDNVVKNWNYVYDNIDNHNAVNAKDFPLVLTEPVWNTNKNKLATSQIVFEELEVPIFALVKSPIAQLYHMNRSSGLVIDVGASTTSVTPILDGIIQTKSSFHNKFAGDYANLHVLNFFQRKLGDDYITKLLPASYQSSANVSASFKNYYASYNSVQDFKQSMLSINQISPAIDAQIKQQKFLQQQQYQGYQQPLPPTDISGNSLPKNYQLANDTYVSVGPEDKDVLLEPIFEPHLYKLPNVQLPEPTIESPQTHGLTQLILLSLKHLENANTSGNEANHQAMNSMYGKFNEILRELLSNIVVTGGGSLIEGFDVRVGNDIRRSLQAYFNNYSYSQGYKYFAPLRNYQVGDVNNVWDRKFGSWLGACNLASMLNESDSSYENGDDEGNGVNIALDNWFVTKADYQELGEDLILEKFK